MTSVPEIFREISRRIADDYRVAQAIGDHRGDRGNNVETILKEFIQSRLPSAYGLKKGQIIFPSGNLSHAIDIIIYDRLYGAPFAMMDTATIPSTCVYGVIEVKSSLTKAELMETLEKLELLHSQFDRDRSFRPLGGGFGIAAAKPRPFASIVAFQLRDNSLTSLCRNLAEFVHIHPSTFEFLSSIVVNGIGTIIRQLRNVATEGTRRLLVFDNETMRSDGYSHVQFKRIDNQMDAIGDFYLDLLTTLNAMVLGVPDLKSYWSGTSESE